MRYPLPDYVRLILDRLHQNGHSAYAVGGCVRDLLAGVTPHDYDIATDALPERVQRLFERTAATGIRHGTVTVILPGGTVEVTTYRTESGYSDGRRPDGVRFVGDIREDLGRRDFTVNAMAYNEREGLIDCFGGQADMAGKILRAVGDASTRFEEDALRILRLFRFAATLGFTPETQTLRAAIDRAPGLSRISRERITAELKKTACGAYPQAIDPLLSSGGLAFLGLSGGQKLSRIGLLPQKEPLRFYALLLLCGGEPEALRCSNAECRYCRAMERLSLPDGRAGIKRALRTAGAEALLDYLTLQEVIFEVDTAAVRRETEEVLRSGEPYLLEHLAVGGQELAGLGITGVRTGEILSRLLEAVTEDPAKNTPEALMQLTREVCPPPTQGY